MKSTFHFVSAGTGCCSCITQGKQKPCSNLTKLLSWVLGFIQTSTQRKGLCGTPHMVVMFKQSQPEMVQASLQEHFSCMNGKSHMFFTAFGLVSMSLCRNTRGSTYQQFVYEDQPKVWFAYAEKILSNTVQKYKAV